jgi:hypothetical protein
VQDVDITDDNMFLDEVEVDLNMLYTLVLGANLGLQAKAALSNPCKLRPRVCNAYARHKGGSAMFYRKSMTLEIA